MSDGMRFNIRVESNTNEFFDEFDTAMERALYAIGVKAVEGSVNAISGRYDIAPAVDTGRLRASISFITPTDSGDSGEANTHSKAGDKLTGKAEKNSVVVGSNVEYADYVHNGTSRMEGRPFLRVGIEQTKGEMERQVTTILRGGTI